MGHVAGCGRDFPLSCRIHAGYTESALGGVCEFGVPMTRLILAGLSAILLFAADLAQAQGRGPLGWGRLFTNDYLGDNSDRWRTGSYTVSKVTGFGWDGERPDRAGEIVEFRFRSNIIAPDNLSAPTPGDRRYAGVLAFGLHTHFQRQGAEISLGGDLVFTGPQTGIGDFHREMHKILHAPRPNVLEDQIGNGVHPTAYLEAGRPFRITPGVEVRPFVELQAGVETLVRIGGDVTLGRSGQDALMLRDVVTGHRIRATRPAKPGLAFVLGADIAHVEHSVYLPVYDGNQLTPGRQRVRAGVHWQGEKSAVFYGLTWLSREFEAQPDAQVVGSVRLQIRF